MKKICALAFLLFASNGFAQQLNLGAILSGNTNDVICYVHGTPGDPTSFQSIACDNKNGLGGRMALGKQANEGAIMGGFVGSGRWDLAATFIGKANNTVFVFTKK